MKIIDVMTKHPAIINETAKIIDGIEKMQHSKCGILPIGEENNIVGVVTDRDIVIRAVAKGKDVTTTPIKDIMTTDVIFCQEDNTLEDAVAQMSQHNIRRVVVRNNEQQVTGILSLGDVIKRAHDKECLCCLFRNLHAA
ncbi:MAG: CBS domain-containing protein [Gammaproteobacteria bacterium]